MSGETLEGLDHLKCPSAQFYDCLLMLPKLKKRMKSSGVIIIILNENSLHMSHYGRINSHVVFTKDLHQYLVYKDFHQIFVVGGVETLEKLKTMDILDSTTTFSQMLEWTQHAC